MAICKFDKNVTYGRKNPPSVQRAENVNYWSRYFNLYFLWDNSIQQESPSLLGEQYYDEEGGEVLAITDNVI